MIWLNGKPSGPWCGLYAIFLPMRLCGAAFFFSGTFSELIGIHREAVLPEQDRTIVWFSADATPSRIGGVNWNTRGYFVEEPDKFTRPLLPTTRDLPHINEIEYLVEVMCTALWGYDDNRLIICGVTDNITSNSWITKGKARRGAGLTIARTFHLWLLRQAFKFYSFYSRSEHNISADFLSRSPPGEINAWAQANGMTRAAPGATWEDFVKTSLLLGRSGILITYLPCMDPGKCKWLSGSLGRTASPRLRVSAVFTHRGLIRGIHVLHGL